MRSIITSSVALLALLPSIAAGAAGPKINAFTNIDWTKVTGTTVAPVTTCTSSSLFGMPYTNTTTGDYYVCSGAGWVLVAGGGSVSVNVNGSSVSSPNFNDTTPAKTSNGLNITWQHSGSNVSAELVGDGVITHFLNGQGGFTTPAGGGTIGGSGTTNTIPKFTSSTDIGNSAVSDNGTTVTSSEPVAVTSGGGVGGTVDLTEGTAATGASGHDVLYADSTAHCIKQSLNGGSFACLGSGGGSAAPVWERQGVFIAPTSSDPSPQVQEVSVVSGAPEAFAAQFSSSYSSVLSNIRSPGAGNRLQAAGRDSMSALENRRMV